MDEDASSNEPKPIFEKTLFFTGILYQQKEIHIKLNGFHFPG